MSNYRKLPPIVVIGPSGCGKSTLARALAEEMDRDFIEGDDHHTSENRAKMRSGQALSDEDRRSFLNSIGRGLAASTRGAVASCSGLRRLYRDRLRHYRDDILFVWIDVEPAELERRLRERTGHFIPPSLLHSQLAAFEPPTAEENFVKIDGDLPTKSQVDEICRHLASRIDIPPMPD